MTDGKKEKRKIVRQKTVTTAATGVINMRVYIPVQLDDLRWNSPSGPIKCMKGYGYRSYL